MGDRSFVNKFKFMDDEMQCRESLHQLRRLRSISPLSPVEVMIDGRVMINFSSNDYLGLSKHPLLKERAEIFMERYGTGSTASRLISGSYDCFDRVERKLAALKQAESALLFNSGFQANVSIIPVLADQKTLVLSDRLNHNSIIQGILLSRCDKILYSHNDLDHLRQLLESNAGMGYSRRLIVTESVFSMDGDTSDIEALVSLAKSHNALLMIDDAHATGVLGTKGMGLTCGKDVDVVIGTFSKALGSFGAYAACSNQMRDYLINCCAGFIYSTALPPPVVGAIDAALDLVPKMEHERNELLEKSNYLRNALKRLGFNTGNSTTQIVPVIVGDEEKTLILSKNLDERGFMATAIRPPTVPRGQSRIRLAMSTAHTREHIDGLVEVFAKRSF